MCVWWREEVSGEWWVVRMCGHSDDRSERERCRDRGSE